MKKTEWISPTTITGPPAENEFYFDRPDIKDDFWELIKKGCHILFTAPRRVGKSSLMKNIVKTNKTEYLCVYENIESVSKSETFYKRFFEIMLKLLIKEKQTLIKLKRWLKSKKIQEFSLNLTVKIGNTDYDYKHELLKLIKELVNLDKKVIIFLDEFPEVLNSIIKNESKKEGIEVLHTLREIRQNSDFKNINLILAGSIGLEHVVETIDREKLINDLSLLKIPPLKFDETKRMIDQIMSGASMKINNQLKNYLLDKVKYLVPFFIQIMIEECDDILRKEERIELKEKDIDTAFTNIIDTYENKFHDWEARLKDYLFSDSYKFCQEVLTNTAHNDKIGIQSIFDIAGKYNQRDNYIRLIKMLKKDGYIDEDNNVYQFVSPILKEWWQKQHPEFELNN